MFIAFEGGEGCGKSTQSKLLLERLKRQNIPVILTHEPGGTVLGDEVRKLLKKQRDFPISPQAELFLFSAARAQLVDEVIYPALQEGKVVICDRFAYSTLVYQGYGRGVDLAVIKLINNIATRGLNPDLAILLDIAPEQGLARKRSQKDRFESEELAFHQRVREGYLKLAASDSDHWLVIDASLPEGTIAELAWERVSQLLPCRFPNQ